jgi:hypothetical protein
MKGMTKAILTRCLLVSLLISVVATLMTTSIMGAPIEESVIDLEAIDEQVVSQLSDEEFGEYLESLPKREVTGIERFTYAYGHPQVWLFLTQALLNWFIAIFSATLIVSYLNAKDT